jgi:hypothetical protein
MNKINYLERYLSLFKKKNKFYYNYSIDKRFKFKIYKNKLVLLEKKVFIFFNFYKKIYSSKDKNICERWKKINKIIIKKNRKVNFLLFYSIQC